MFIRLPTDVIVASIIIFIIIRQTLRIARNNIYWKCILEQMPFLQSFRSGLSTYITDKDHMEVLRVLLNMLVLVLQ